MTPPKRLIVAGKEARLLAWLNSLRDFAVAHAPVRGVNHRLSITTNGASIVPSGGGGSSGPAPEPSTVAQYRVKSSADNHLVCHTWDGVAEGSLDIKIAKPYKLRKLTYDGVRRTHSVSGKSFLYTYASSSSRTVVVSNKTWTQYINPDYIADDVIYASTIDETTIIAGDTSVELVDLNADGRQWATRLPYCDNGAAKTFLAAGEYPPY